MYTCVAKTPTTGTDTASGELVVEGIKPAIEDHSDLHQFVQEDDDYQVLCKIIGGDPKPEQKWYKVCLKILVLMIYHFYENWKLLYIVFTKFFFILENSEFLNYHKDRV